MFARGGERLSEREGRELQKGKSKADRERLMQIERVRQIERD